MTVLEEFDIDERTALNFSMASLKAEINRREESIKGLKWAIAEHQAEIDKSNKLILWKLENGNKQD